MLTELETICFASFAETIRMRVGLFQRIRCLSFSIFLPFLLFYRFCFRCFIIRDITSDLFQTLNDQDVYNREKLSDGGDTSNGVG